MRLNKALFSILLMLAVLIPAIAEEGSPDAAAPGVAEGFRAEDKVDIALVTTYSKDYLWSKRIIDHLDECIASAKKKAHTFYFSLEDVNDLEGMNAELERLHEGMDACRPDFVYLVGSTSFAFTEDVGSWYPGIPMVLIGGQDYAPTKNSIVQKHMGADAEKMTADQIRSDYNVIFQNNPVYIHELVDLIYLLRPDIEKLYYIGGGDQFSSFKEYNLRTYLGIVYPEIELVDINAAETSDELLIKKLGAADPVRSAVIYSSWPSSEKDQSGSLRINSTLASIATLNVPVFTMRDNGWMDASADITGGCFMDDDDYFKELDEITSKLLDGVDPGSIGDYKAGRPTVKLNYEKMLELGMDPSICPAGTIFTHSPERYFSDMSRLKKAASLVIMLLLILIVIMAFRYQRGLSYAKETIDNMPLEYSRSKLIKDKYGNLVDFRTVYGNKIIKDYHDAIHESIGTRTFREFYPKHAEEFMAYLNDAYQKGEKGASFTLYNQYIDRYKTFTAIFLKGGMLGLIGKDITEERLAAERLEEAKRKAERADLTKTAFIHNISHEIRTPLNAITGFSQLLALPGDFCTEEEKAQFGEYILNNTEMLTMVINDLLNISAIEDGKYNIMLSDCRCNEICSHALKSVEHRVPGGVDLLFESEVGDDFIFTSDSQRIQQILINYLTNACKHTRKGSIKLSVSLSENPGKVTFAVTDTGHGVKDEDAEKIFERYVMLDSVNYDGKGLGLYICSQLSELLGGQVRLDTDYKDGARFLLILDNVHEGSEEAAGMRFS